MITFIAGCFAGFMLGVFAMCLLWANPQDVEKSEKQIAAEKMIDCICKEPPIWDDYKDDHDGYSTALEHSLGELITAIEIVRGKK